MDFARTIRKWSVLCGTLIAVMAGECAVADATPIFHDVGAARVTLSVAPDPPRVGSNDFVVKITGAPSATLEKTTVRFSTLMPTMNMTGPAGDAMRIGSNSWRFTATLGMAAPWSVQTVLSGGIKGIATFNYTLSTQNAAMLSTAAPMAAMNVNSGNPNAWETAFFALLIAMIAGYFIIRRDRRPIAIVLGFVGIAAVVVLAFAQARYGAQPMDMNAMSQAQGSAPTPVTFATVGDGLGAATIAAPANIQPYFSQNIVARTSGLLTDLTAYTGDQISAGQVVAHLQEPELQSNAQAAQAGAVAAQNQRSSAQYDAVASQADVAAKQQQLTYWKSEIRREKMLLDQGAVSVREYQDERAQAAAAQSAYDAAGAKLAAAAATIRAAQAQAAQAGAQANAQNVMAGYTGVIVPDDAVVVKRLVDPGVYVQAGTPILQVAVIHRLRVQAQVAQSDMPSVHAGAPIDVRFDDGRTLRGRISSVSPVADPATHTAIAEAIVENPGNRLQPGGFAHVLIHAQRRTAGNTLSVPSASVVGGESSAVWINENGSAHRVPVSVLSDDGTIAQVRGGDLRPGMRVVVVGAQNLEEGQPITGAAQ